MHLGAHIPNLFFVESVRAFYRSYFGVLSDYTPLPDENGFGVPQGAGIGVRLNASALQRADLLREVSSGAGLAVGKRAMGDHWSVENIR
ncbi:MAG: hypothetical protein HXY40_13110 [Chloroflexi bacterium]|nr:hypothetical protein [Chloroflexota bacterium]